MSRLVDEGRLAFMLLTRFPMGTMRESPALSDAVWAYPLAGAVVGFLTGLIFHAAAWAGLPPAISALLAIATAVLMTGGIHEDGLADLADGLGGGRTKERRLEIMRDSRIGSYGVLALVLAVGLRAEALVTLPLHNLPLLLAGLGAVSRGLLPAVMLALPPARTDGLGQSAGQHISRGRVLTGLLLALVIALVCGINLPVLLVMAVAASVPALLGLRKIGGFTGDVLGAAQQVAEIAGLCMLATHFTI